MKLLGSLEDEFQRRVPVGLSPDDCWEWLGAVNTKGYGTLGYGGTQHYAHRLAYQFNHGDPGKLCVCHRCDNPPCVNPNHLWLGTDADNLRDMWGKGRARPVVTNLHPPAHKLSDTDEEAVRWLVAKGYSQSRVARMFEVSDWLISRTLNRD